jgi:8-demethyl-8-(2-methoxy-alpha-L-rhamnosyl)tetracenomycin-C 3'-O-methyltransferase
MGRTGSPSIQSSSLGSPGRIRTLDDIALEYHTDKASDGHGYTKYYERILGPHRYRSMVLLELGVWHGASLLMWAEYLPNAQIIGVDTSAPIVVDDPNVTIWQADQCDPELGPHIRKWCGDLDVIIDDASHISSNTIKSFQNLWPFLKPGGFYVIEDLQTSYDPENYGREEADEDPVTPVFTAMGFCKRLADEVQRHQFPNEYWLGYAIESVCFYENICIVQKASS